MKKNKVTMIISRTIVVFLFTINTFSLFAQKGKDDPNVARPNRTETAIVSALYDKVRRQYVAEKESVSPLNQTNFGIANYADIDRFLANNPSVGVHFITKDKLIDFLYNTNLATERQHFGFRVWFSKYKSELALVRAGGEINIRDLSTDYLWLSPKSEKPQDIFKTAKLPLDKLKNGFKHSIKGYFIGRNAIMRNIVTADGNVKLEVAGIRMDVRENLNHDYSIVFYVVNNDKSSTYIGLASFDETFGTGRGSITHDKMVRETIKLDKMGSCRPCPPYCNN